MKDFKIMECIEKLEPLEKEKRIAIVWQWIKEGYVNLKQFKALLDYI